MKETKPPMDHALTLLSPFILILYFFPHPPKLCLCSSVVLSPDAGGTLVLVFIPTWLTNRLLMAILTITNCLSGHNALLLILAPIDLLTMNVKRSSVVSQIDF